MVVLIVCTKPHKTYWSIEMSKKRIIAVCAVVLLLLLTVLVIALLRSCAKPDKEILSDEYLVSSQGGGATKTQQPEHNSQSGEEHANESKNTTPEAEKSKPETRQLLFVEEIYTTEDNSIIIDIKTLLGEGQDISDILLVSLDDSQNGTITDNGDGTYTYTPGNNFFGDDTLEFTISDSTGKETTASLGVVVSSVNDPPRAKDDALVTDEDTPILIEKKSLLKNDTDKDSKLRVVKAAEPQYGTLTDNGDGTYTYTPDADYFGSDGFTYTISDGEKKDTAEVIITVNPVNDAPVAQDDTVTTDEDTQIVITSLLSNDIDLDLDPLSIVSMTAAAHGVLTDNGNGTYTYTPDAEYSGSDSFTYTISDGKKEDSAEVSITVSHVNDAPEAQNDSFTTDEDAPILISGLLDNDSDKESDSLAIVSTAAPVHGTLADNGDGTYTYSPDADYFGYDSFMYTISDGDKQDTAEVDITINSVNDAPVALDDAFTTDEDTQVMISDLLGNDSDVDLDSLSIVSTTIPSNGTLSDNGNGTYTYTPDADYHGSDSFTYTVSDGDKQDTAQVSITIYSVNDAPVAVDDAFLISEDSVLHLGEGSLLGNDTDADKDPLAIVSVTDPGNGTLQDNGDGTYTYTPNADYYGGDSFTYTINDGSATDTASVTILVTALNDAPVAGNDVYNTDEDIPLNIAAVDLLSNDMDEEGDTLTIASTMQPSHGILLDNGNGTYTYTPNANYNGSDSFMYTISDGIATDTARVTITITAVSDAPIADNDAVDTDKDIPLIITAASLLSNDSDADGDTLTIISTTAPSNGTLNNNGDGTYTYTPNAGYFGGDSFNYTISDGAQTDTATVTITVNFVNHAPVAASDSYITNINTALTISVANMLSNDTDAEGDTITMLSVSNPGHGTLTDNSNGTYTYTPDTDYYGSDSFTYTISDGTNTDEGTVQITVNAIPEAHNDGTVHVNMFSTSYKNIYVLSNDTDADGDTLEIISCGGNSAGTLRNDGYRLRYKPEYGWGVEDQKITYVVSDGKGGTDTATFTIIVDW